MQWSEIGGREIGSGADYGLKIKADIMLHSTSRIQHSKSDTRADRAKAQINGDAEE
jgi:hypothetical protein